MVPYNDPVFGVRSGCELRQSVGGVEAITRKVLGSFASGEKCIQPLDPGPRYRDRKSFPRMGLLLCCSADGDIIVYIVVLRRVLRSWCVGLPGL